MRHTQQENGFGVSDRSSRRVDRHAKCDTTGARPCSTSVCLGVLLVLASPFILLCMIAVRLGSKGSPLYSQKRLGCCGRIFTIYKIRTMYEDCERHFGPMWSGPGDPRVTPLGGFSGQPISTSFRNCSTLRAAT